MRVPLEILVQILEWVELGGDAAFTLQLRLVSKTVNEEVLKVLMRSDKINPSDTIKLLEIHRVNVQPHKKLHHILRYRDRNEPLSFGYEKTAKSFPQHLIRPYLIGRMDRAEQDPCLFSILMGRSIDLVVEHHHTDFDRQKLAVNTLSSFDTTLLHAKAEGLFDTLFDTHGLNYWLPHYDAAHLTIQPKFEDNLRLFYIFRLSHNVLQLGGDVVIKWTTTRNGGRRRPLMKKQRRRDDGLSDLLSEPPKTPAYARLFAIDCFNLIANSGSTVMLHDLMVSNTGKLVSTLDLPEHVWCAVKQGKTQLAIAFAGRALREHCSNTDVPLGWRQNALLRITDILVRNGEETHFGRTVIQELLDCKNMEALRALMRELDLESLSIE